MDRLDNTVRPYAWGSATAIPELLGTEPTGQPQAELWLGAHPGAPSRLDRGAGPVTLADVIAADPAGELGEPTVRALGPRLPFLLKVLAAESALSLQVHPDLAQAKVGFAEEEARGVPVDAPHRNYKDANHKPELICALTPFEGLCGFRPPQQAAALLERLGVDELKPHVERLRSLPADQALRETLTALLSADRHAMADTVAQTARAAATLTSPEATTDGVDVPDAERAAYAACVDLARDFPGDPGVIAALLLHHVRLHPGEALFLAAGVPHAYLRGLGVEIMANSDNVLRCGLTPKHVDVPELLRIVRFEPADDPGVLRPAPDAGGERVYAVPVPDFRLSQRALTPGAAAVALDGHGPQILLCTAGHALLRDANGEELRLRRGQSAYARAGERVELSGDGTVFRATVAGTPAA